MSRSEPPSPVLFFNTLVAYQDTAALKAALELGLFTATGQSRATAASVLELRFHGPLARRSSA